MSKFNQALVKYTTPRNRKILVIILSLIGLAIASGAPGAGSGIGGGPGVNSLIGF